jgi:hypothetical protein
MYIYIYIYVYIYSEPLNALIDRVQILRHTSTYTQVKYVTEEDLETTEGEEVHLLTTSWSWRDGR